jgi:hypothetical protein
VGILDRLLGREPKDRTDWEAPPARPSDGAGRSEDEQAIERYRYLLRTAPPDQVEQAHAEAFARLTPEQRRQVLEQVGAAVPPGERATSDDPQSLARMATRAEVRQPGTMERVLGGRGMGGGMAGGMGLGGIVAGSLLASVAGAFVGTAIADAMFDMSDAGDADVAGGESGAGTEDAAGAHDAGGYDDTGTGGDLGGDVGGDFGGDFGGGDFGGGF